MSPMSPRLLRPRASGLDPDASVYIAAVEAADGQSLEAGVRTAINDFVKGCKADGIWSAIKASCILSGARTLSGALVPLVGTAPTNSNFVSGDYNRKTGLKGNGSNKTINSNRNNTTDPQDSKHLAVWRSEEATTSGGLLGSLSVSTGASHLFTGLGNFFTRNNCVSQVATTALTTHPGALFYGCSRISNSTVNLRIATTNYQSTTATSETPNNETLRVFETFGVSDARIAFYSIGEQLNLTLFGSRVSALVSAIGAAIT